MQGENKDKGTQSSKDPNKNTDTARSKMEARAIELLCDNTNHYSHKKIATMINKEFSTDISRQWVTHIKAKHETAWQDSIKANIHDLKVAQLTKLSYMFAEYMELYAESGEEEVTVTVVGELNSDGKFLNKGSKAKRVTKKRLPDKSILDSVVNVINQENKLLGLYTENVKLSGEVTTSLELRQSIKGLSNEELLQKLSENMKYLEGLQKKDDA
jgi:hypothetical protein